MNRRYRRIQLASCCVFIFITSCGSTRTFREADRTADFPREISRLERMACYHPEDSVRAESHLHLAFLYLNPKNPRLDYGQALQELTRYMSLNLRAVSDETLLSWVAALKELERLRLEGIDLAKRNQDLRSRAEKLQTGMERAQEANKTLRDEVSALKEANQHLKGQNHNLRETNQNLKEANQNLKETNHKLSETIESLKALDAQMEEKRKQIK